MAIGDIYKLAVVGIVHGHLAINTFHYRHASGPAPSVEGATLLGNTWLQFVGEPILGAQSQDYKRLRVEVQKIFPLPVLSRLDIPAVLQGEQAGPSVPDTVAAVIRRRAALAGRQFRGRLYLPAIAAGLYDPATGGWDPLGIELNAIAATMSPDLISLTTPDVWEQILWNRVAFTGSVVVSGSVDVVPRSQRRRELDVGI